MNLIITYKENTNKLVPSSVQLRKILFISFMLLLMFNFPSFAMHEAIDCITCHNSLSAQNGKLLPSDIEVNSYCLTCHDANADMSGLDAPHVMNNNGEMAGGDFFNTLLDEKLGHNVLSEDFTLGNIPPGGDEMSSFTCLSCHAAHHNGNYRNLRKSINGVSTIVRAQAAPDYINNLYISGMDDFCGSCHRQFHGIQNTKRGSRYIRHPVGITLSQAKEVSFYEYIKIEDPVTKVENPDGNALNKYSAKVFCLSCHYAHASQYKNSLRWDGKKPGAGQGCYECHDINSLE